MNSPTWITDTGNSHVLHDTYLALRQIDMCIWDCKARVHELTLSELHSERDTLMKCDSLIPIEQGTPIVNSGVIIHQSTIKVALLHAREEILRCIDARLGFPQRGSSYPTHESVLDRYEDPDYTPDHYPDWTERQWKSLWHTYRETLRDLAHEEHIEAFKQERQEEEEKIEKDNTLSRLLGLLVNRRDRIAERNAL